MSRFLLLDVGAGTLDLLWVDTASGLHYKAVCRSPVLTVAETARALQGDILVTGMEMGGGALSRVLKEKARTVDVVMSVSASATVHHDPDRVRSYGIRVVENDEAVEILQRGRHARLVCGDLDPDRLRGILAGLGVPLDVDVVGVCAQDHGVPPRGVSHLDYRHRLFRAALDRDPRPHHLLYRDDGIPPAFNRLRSIAAEARKLPAGEVYVMDSGMAAVIGASLDSNAAALRRLLVLDVATSHTVAAALEEGELCGFCEYHTTAVTLDRLDALLRDLAEGTLRHEDILAEGGHGAYIRRAFGFSAVERIVATGPRRGLLAGSDLEIHLGAPWGDNMMTGTVGLLDAIFRRKGLESLDVT